MLARYKIYRGSRPADDPLPAGHRQDTRKHTRHCLRPLEEQVTEYLSAPSAAAWARFESAYLQVLDERFAADRRPFDRIAELAAEGDVHLGCSCPTARNPDVGRCHTVAALRFMRKKYQQLDVRLPTGADS